MNIGNVGSSSLPVTLRAGGRQNVQSSPPQIRFGSDPKPVDTEPHRPPHHQGPAIISRVVKGLIGIG